MDRTSVVSPPVSGIVFAGGKSKRMGQIKALMPYGESTFLETLVEKMKEAGIDPIIVVLSHNAEEIIRRTRLPGDIFVINRSRNFVRTGLEAIVERVGSPSAILLCPVDIPSIRVVSLRSLARAAVSEGASLMLPMRGWRIAGTVAVISGQFLPWSMRLSPLFFRSNLFSYLFLFFLLAILVISRQCRFRVLKTDDPSVLQNVNTQLDYRKLQKGKS